MDNDQDMPVLLDRESAVSWLRLNRPAALNTIDVATAQAFLTAVRAVAEDAEARVLVISGNGRGFCAGGDLASFHADPEHGADTANAIIGPLHEALQLMQRMPLPVLASVHGPIAGGGMSLALSTDLCIAADNAKFSFAYARLGVSPDVSGSYHLPRLIGLRRAMDMALLGDTINAAEALRLGLVNRVVPAADLAAETQALANRLANGPTAAYGRIKGLLRRSGTAEFADQLAAEQESFASLTGTADFREGVAAFIGKREAHFHGR